MSSSAFLRTARARPKGSSPHLHSEAILFVALDTTMSASLMRATSAIAALPCHRNVTARPVRGASVVRPARGARRLNVSCAATAGEGLKDKRIPVTVLTGFLGCVQASPSYFSCAALGNDGWMHGRNPKPSVASLPFEPSLTSSLSSSASAGLARLPFSTTSSRATTASASSSSRTSSVRSILTANWWHSRRVARRTSCYSTTVACAAPCAATLSTCSASS